MKRSGSNLPIHPAASYQTEARSPDSPPGGRAKLPPKVFHMGPRDDLRQQFLPKDKPAVMRPPVQPMRIAQPKNVQRTAFPKSPVHLALAVRAPHQAERLAVRKKAS